MYKSTLWILAAIFGLSLSTYAVDKEATEKNWKRHCSKCHADDGSGDTRLGKRLEVIDYTDPESLKKFSDEELFDMTKDGVEDTKMPGYAKKLSDEEIHALVEYMRSFAEES